VGVEEGRCGNCGRKADIIVSGEVRRQKSELGAQSVNKDEPGVD
jgi:hypothetical protein